MFHKPLILKVLHSFFLSKIGFVLHNNVPPSIAIVSDPFDFAQDMFRISSFGFPAAGRSFGFVFSFTAGIAEIAEMVIFLFTLRPRRARR